MHVGSFPGNFFGKAMMSGLGARLPCSRDGICPGAPGPLLGYFASVELVSRLIYHNCMAYLDILSV